MNLLLLITFGIFVTESLSKGAPTDLYADIFKNYNPKVIPTKKNGDKIDLFIALSPIYLRELDEKTQVMTLDSWVLMIWKDPSINWDPSQHGGIENLNVPSTDIWKPDLGVYNTSPDKKLLPQVMTNAIVNKTGVVTWVPPFTIYARCNLEVDDYPGDTQICNVKFGLWTLGSNSVNFSSQNEVTLSDFSNDNPTWHVEQITFDKEDKYYDCCPNEYYSTITYNFHLKRKGPSAASTVQGVCCFAVFLSLLMFWLPPDSTHKIILGAISEALLALASLYLGVVIDTPGSRSKASNTVSPIMCTVGIFLVIQVFVINIARMTGPCAVPQFITDAAKGICQPLRFYMERIRKSNDKDEENQKASDNNQQNWKLVAMAFDRMAFFVAIFVIVILRFAL